MIPILFEEGSTDFSTTGIGALVDCYSCAVTEERNGVYELALKYKIGGQYYKQITYDKVIAAVPFKGGTRQGFDIYNIINNLDGTIEVLARHVSYRANYVPIKPFSATGMTAIIDGLDENALETNPFTIESDYTAGNPHANETSYYQQTVPRSLRACLGGDEGSVLDVFSSHNHCEFEWDNFIVKIWYDRGSDNGYEIRYAKNLTELQQEIDVEDQVTGVIAYWVNAEDPTITVYGEVQHSENASNLPYNKTICLNVSEKFDTTPTLNQLNEFAASYVEKVSDIADSLDISFYDIDDQSVNLCDTVKVIFTKLGIEKTFKVIKTKWDVLLERYDMVTVGNPKSNLASTLIETIDAEAFAVATAGNNRIVNVVRTIDAEVGEIAQTIEEVDASIIKYDGFNYSPFFSRDVNDSYSLDAYEILVNQPPDWDNNWGSYFEYDSVYDAYIPLSDNYETDPGWVTNTYYKILPGNDSGYWAYVSDGITNIEDSDGWAEVTIDATQEDNPALFVVRNDPRIADNKVTVLLEIKDVETDSLDIWAEFLESVDYTDINGNEFTDVKSQYYTSDIVEFFDYDHVYRIELNSTDYQDPGNLICGKFVIDEGFTASFKVRVSMYKEGYLGYFIPYVTPHGEINDTFVTTESTIREMTSKIDQQVNQISSLVSFSETIESDVLSKADENAENITSEQLTKFYSTKVTQYCDGIETKITEKYDQTIRDTATTVNSLVTVIKQDSNGVTVAKEGADIKGVFGNTSLDFVNANNEKMAWLSVEDGLGANKLSVGDSNTKNKRWNITVSSDGSYLRFSRHG